MLAAVGAEVYPLNFETKTLCFIIFKANNLEANKPEKPWNLIHSYL